MIGSILREALTTTVLVSGLVVIMMMIIEEVEHLAKGRLTLRLRSSRWARVVGSALLGSIPGCLGGFACVSLYTHRMMGFGALLAMMIATAGDEAFVMLALFPAKAALLFAILLALGIVVGLVVEYAVPLERSFPDPPCSFEEEHAHAAVHSRVRHWGWKRIVMLLGTAVFLVLLLSGCLEEETGTGTPLLDEAWLYWLFALLSLPVSAALVAGSDEWVEEHLWHHIICRHLPAIFAWTFGVLTVMGVLLQWIDLREWMGDNAALMVLLAVAVGLIPQSGPHLVFVSLFAAGVIPMPVLLANSISQEGHAGLPLLAGSRKTFLLAKAIKAALALAVGYLALLF